MKKRKKRRARSLSDLADQIALPKSPQHARYRPVVIQAKRSHHKCNNPTQRRIERYELKDQAFDELGKVLCIGLLAAK